MRIRFFIFAAAAALILSACHKVEKNNVISSETVSQSAYVTEVFPTQETETDTVTASGITEAVRETAVTSITTNSDTETSDTAAPETETSKDTMTESSLPEQTSAAPETNEYKPADTVTETLSSSGTTSLTLQFESPYEAEDLPSPSVNSYQALNYSEQKGIWITYLEYMSILKNKSEDSFRSSIEEYFGNVSSLGFNTVYVQVRAFGDAYYRSDIFPSGEQYNGTIGAETDFDALSVMVSAAHEKGLSIHAWVNPMRLMTSSQLEGISSRFPIKKWYDSDEYRGKYIVRYGDRWYLDPAYDEVTELIADGITEILVNYDVDGIQIDDYFYPMEDPDFDSEAYAASGTGLSLSEWRIGNVNKMVRKLYKTVHSANKTAVFGISPQGSVENDYKGSADVRTWCSESGYCDYILPQVYFGFENAALPYADVISRWSGMVTDSSVKLVIGLAAYKIGAEDTYAGASGKNEWIENNNIISEEMKLAGTLGNYGGVALYRYESVFSPSPETAAAVSTELENIRKQTRTQ